MYWNPLWELRKWFGACLDAIEAGVITADQIPPESGLNDEVVAALKPLPNGIFPTSGVGATHLSISAASTRSYKRISR